MTATAIPLDVCRSSDRSLASGYWLLRIGAALCFIGHGAFGFITKAAWVPYFGVVGIPESWAWRLMPIVGAVDVTAAMAVLFAPRALPLVYMGVWAAWTALLRPLAGEPAWEAVERAGNYGVPFALLALTGALSPTRASLLSLRATWVASPLTLGRVRAMLRWTTTLLLLGHGALGALTHKPLLTSHWAVLGLPASTTALAGWMEIGLAALVAWRPTVALLVGVAAWKLATESLWIATGAPLWEFVERSGSYVAPLALAMLMSRSNAASPSTIYERV